MANLHMRIDGTSRDLELENLGLTINSSDRDVKDALARFLDKPSAFLDSFHIARSNSTITVRPEAMFGC